MSNRSIAMNPRPGARLTDELARRYLARVIVHARRLARRLPPHVALNDLISAGLLGVVEGFLRFDPDRAETLDAYLDHRIRGALLDELRRADPLSRAQRGFARQLGRAAQAAANDSGSACDESLAEALGLSLAEFQARVAQVQVAVTIQGTGYEECVPDEAIRPDEEVAGRQEHRILADATGSLRPREREVLRLHYEEGQTFREIGSRFNVSESRISQLHTHAIQNLRSILSA
jgi:RNA polymerase sigma factor for flagellar operon FliA